MSEKSHYKAVDATFNGLPTSAFDIPQLVINDGFYVILYVNLHYVQREEPYNNMRAK